MAGEVRVDPPVMPRVSCWRNKCPLGYAQQVVLAHDAQNALLVDRPTGTLQINGNPPVSVLPVLQCRSLYGITQLGLFQPWRRCLPMPIIAGPADAGQPA